MKRTTAEIIAIAQFAHAIAHGDEEHQEWLKEAAEAFIEGRPLPPARNKDGPLEEVGAVSFRYFQDVFD